MSKSDKHVISRNTLCSEAFAINRLTQLRVIEEATKKDTSNNMRRTLASNVKGPCQNRSRNKSRHQDSTDGGNQELATSSILSDKLRESLSTLNLQKKASKRYAKNIKNMEKDLNQEKMKQKAEVKEMVRIESKIPRPSKAPNDIKIVNSKVLGNIIKNNINELTSKNTVKQKADYTNSTYDDKASKRTLKNCKNQGTNNKENQLHNEMNVEGVNGIEVYNLSQY